MTLRYTLRAKVELESAFEWYEKQQRGLDVEFLGCIETALNEKKLSLKCTRFVIETSEEILSEDFLFLFLYN